VKYIAVGRVGARAVDLPARSFDLDLARPGVAAPLSRTSDNDIDTEM